MKYLIKNSLYSEWYFLYLKNNNIENIIPTNIDAFDFDKLKKANLKRINKILLKNNYCSASESFTL